MIFLESQVSRCCKNLNRMRVLYIDALYSTYPPVMLFVSDWQLCLAERQSLLLMGRSTASNTQWAVRCSTSARRAICLTRAACSPPSAWRMAPGATWHILPAVYVSKSSPLFLCQQHVKIYRLIEPPQSAAFSLSSPSECNVGQVIGKINNNDLIFCGLASQTRQMV